MKNTIIIVKKKKSPLRLIFKLAAAIVAVAAVCAVVYKYLEKKYRSKILGRIDLDGDGEYDAIMLDTTGNGEVDTIVIDTVCCDEDESSEK